MLVIYLNSLLNFHRAAHFKELNPPFVLLQLLLFSEIALVHSTDCKSLHFG